MAVLFILKVKGWGPKSSMYLQVSTWCCSWLDPYLCLHKMLLQSTGMSNNYRTSIIFLLTFMWPSFDLKQMSLYMQEYKAATSPPVYISPLDLGPKYTDKLGASFQEYCKTYGENYCLGQLISWYNQTNAEPDCSLVRSSRGCLSLPEIGSFYAKVQKPSRHRVYGPRTVRFMLARMVSLQVYYIILTLADLTFISN